MPAEVHEHFDANDVKTGYTVIHRETAWDDETRARALALARYKAGLCGCGCGQPAAESQQKRPYVVHKATCYAGKAIEQVRRQDREKNEKAPDGWDDGLHYFAVPAPTDDKRGPKRGDRTHRAGTPQG